MTLFIFSHYCRRMAVLRPARGRLGEASLLVDSCLPPKLPQIPLGAQSLHKTTQRIFDWTAKEAPLRTSDAKPWGLGISSFFLYMLWRANSCLGMHHTRRDRGPSIHMEFSNRAAAGPEKGGIERTVSFFRADPGIIIVNFQAFQWKCLNWH